MFAYWHLLRMCAQPTRWSVRMIATLLLVAVFTSSWQVSGWIPPAKAQAAHSSHYEGTVVNPGLISWVQLIVIPRNY